MSFYTKLEVNSDTSSSWKHSSQIYLLLILTTMMIITGTLFVSWPQASKGIFPTISHLPLSKPLWSSLFWRWEYFVSERLGNLPEVIWVISDEVEMLPRSVSSRANFSIHPWCFPIALCNFWWRGGMSNFLSFMLPQFSHISNGDKTNLLSLPRATITNEHKLGGLNQKK